MIESGKLIQPLNNVGQTLDVPMDDPVMDNIWSHGLKLRERPMWRSKVEEIARNFDESKLGHGHYCLNHEHSDDGTARAHASLMVGKRTFPIKIGRICYPFSGDLRKGIENKSKPRGSHVEPIGITLSKDDRKWIDAFCFKKWPEIERYVDFRGKSVLDVGCQVGGMIFNAWDSGASKVYGVDVRPSVIDICNAVKARVESESPGDVNIDVDCTDIFSTDGGFLSRADIVSCMGLIHYFDSEKIVKNIKLLCALCRETLILEMRVTKRKLNGLDLRSQVLVSKNWLKGTLGNNDFLVKRKAVLQSKPTENREIWFCERFNNNGQGGKAV